MSTRSPGQKLSLTDRHESLIEVQSMLERGINSPTIIAKALGVDRKTAVKFRDAAIRIDLDNPNNKREAMRSLTIRQMNHQIQQISLRLAELDKSRAKGQPSNDQSYAALQNTLRSYYDSRAKLTGSWQETNLNVEYTKHIFINRPVGAGAAIEGQLVDDIA